MSQATDKILKVLEQQYDLNSYYKMQEHIAAWDDWFKGLTPQHKYKVYTSADTYDTHLKKSLQMAKVVCEKHADLLYNEKVEIQIGHDKKTKLYNHETRSDKEQTMTDVVLSDLRHINADLIINQGIEKSMALGTGAFVWSLNNLALDKDGNPVKPEYVEPVLEFVSADKIIPLSQVGTNITECAFMVEKVHNNVPIIILSVHELIDNRYVISNRIFKHDEENDSIEDITDDYMDQMHLEFDTKSNRKWFSIFKPNIVNNLDYDSPYGISVYANALDTLMAIDEVFDSLNNEFKLGRKRMFVDKRMAMPDGKGNTKPLFDPNDTVFYAMEGVGTLGGDAMDNSMINNGIKEINMELRVHDHVTALDNLLNLLSIKTGLGSKYFEFDNTGVIKTATEVVSDKSDLYKSVVKHSQALEMTLRELYRTFLYIENEFMGKKNIEVDADISIDFDDSIIVDTETMKEDARLDYNAGLIDKVEYFVITRELTEDQAIELVEKMEERENRSLEVDDHEPEGMDFDDITEETEELLKDELDKEQDDE